MLGPVGDDDDEERLKCPFVPRAVELAEERVSGVCHAGQIMRRLGWGRQGLSARLPLSLPPEPLEAVREFRTSVTLVRKLGDEQRERLGVTGDP